MLAPCKDCPGRHVGCHSLCEEYKCFLNTAEEAKRQRVNEALIRSTLTKIKQRRGFDKKGNPTSFKN